jgi:hypothetical protein
MVANTEKFSVSENIIFTKPKANNYGGKLVGILNDLTRKPIIVQTPVMMSYGVNVYDNPNGKNYTLTLQFPREDFRNEDTDNLLDIMMELENIVKINASTHAKDWFGNADMTPDAINEIWSPMLNYPKDRETGEPDKSRSPTLKLKLPVWDGEFKFELFDTNQEFLIPNEDGYGPEECIQKLSNVECTIQCCGIWFANGKFGVNWKLCQGFVKNVVKHSQNNDRKK